MDFDIMITSVAFLSSRLFRNSAITSNQTFRRLTIQLADFPHSFPFFFGHAKSPYNFFLFKQHFHSIAYKKIFVDLYSERLITNNFELMKFNTKIINCQ